MKKLGIIGYPLTHSISRKYFTEKFATEGLSQEWSYEIYPVQIANHVRTMLADHTETVGLNVTIPFKKTILPLLDEITEEAKNIGAVNTICVSRNEEGIILKGHNTDVIGFKDSLKNYIDSLPKEAIILGNGGASKAVQWVLKSLGINFTVAGRNRKNIETEERVEDSVFAAVKFIINTTPAGMYPKVEECPDIPYEVLTPQHFLYDVIYNPDETLFLKKGKEKGCNTQNGMEMFRLQAEAAWEIWQQPQPAL